MVHRDNQGEKMPNILVWDIETIPDISGFAAANNLFDKTAAEVRAAMCELRCEGRYVGSWVLFHQE